jgi:hypothetical protein
MNSLKEIRIRNQEGNLRFAVKDREMLLKLLDEAHLLLNCYVKPEDERTQELLRILES